MAAPKPKPQILRPDFQIPEFATSQDQGEYAFRRLGAEKGLLGSLLIDQGKFPMVDAMLSHDAAGCFYVYTGNLIYQAMQTLHKNNQPINDFHLLVDLLEGKGHCNRGQWQDKLAKILFDYTNINPANVLYYAQSVQAARTRQQLDQKLQAVRRLIADGKYPDDLIPALGDELDALFNAFRVAPPEAVGQSQVTQDVHEAVMAHQTDPDARPMAIPTGFPGLDKGFGGWRRGKYHVVGGLSGMGKTGLMLSCALNAALRGLAVAYYGFADSSSDDTTLRLIGMLADVPDRQFLNGKMTRQEFLKYKDAKTLFDTLPIYLDDRLNTPQKIRNNLQTLLDTKGIDLVFIDYFQEMRSESLYKEDKEVQMLTDVSRALDTMASDLHLPVIVGSQVPTYVTKRNNWMPARMDHSRCTEIARHADVILFVHREHVKDSLASSTMAELKVDKVRGSGQEGAIVECYFDTRTGLFSAFQEDGTPDIPM